MIWALSHDSMSLDGAVFVSVNSTALPPGSIWGPAANSPLLTLTRGSGFPPFSETRIMHLLPCQNRISPAFQLIPQGLSAGHIVTGAPPVTAIFLSVESVDV